MSPTTVFLGRLLGLYLVAISVTMLVSRRRTLATLDEMVRSGPWMLFSGMVAAASRRRRVRRNANRRSGGPADAGRVHDLARRPRQEVAPSGRLCVDGFGAR
jgi:hypothetical protein